MKLADPHHDTLIRGFIYGIGVSPKDHSVWGADYLPYVPGGDRPHGPGQPSAGNMQNGILRAAAW